MRNGSVVGPAWQEKKFEATPVVPEVELRPKGGQFPVSLMQLWIQLVTVGNVPLRGVERVLEIVGRFLGQTWPCPDATTGRSWLLRLGCAELTRPLDVTEDWIWIMDHTVQIGKQKVLVIAGIRDSQLPPVGQALRREDLQLIALVPQTEANKQTVHAELERAACRTGVPRAILSDHGGDLLAALRLFQEQHPETVDLYDIAHKLACLLKPRLEGDPRWTRFVAAMSRCKNQLAQTELAGLIPPRLRPKARFMNLSPVIQWGLRISRLLARCRAGNIPVGLTAARIEEKLGWLDEFQMALAEWSEWLGITRTTLHMVRTHGYSLGTPGLLRARLTECGTSHESSGDLVSAVQDFVTDQCQQLRAFERLPGSSEVLESTFGKFKLLERHQSQGGFTGLILALGSLLGRTAAALPADLITAWERSGVKNVVAWIKSALGQTVTSQRRVLLGTVE